MSDREDKMLDLYKTHAYLPHDAENNPLTPFGNFAKGYELAWKARGELDAVKIKELEDEIIGWQEKSIEREQHLRIANSAVEELTAKLDKARKEDEANERWLAQLASECSDPNQ